MHQDLGERLRHGGEKGPAEAVMQPLQVWRFLLVYSVTQGSSCLATLG
jgi:hypothetical protein